jgi:alanine racemase
MRNHAQMVIELSHLYANLEHIKKNNSAEIIAMVKADAYGHGALIIVEAMLRFGIKHFGVATLAEAINLRQHFNLLPFEIFVFSETCLEEALLHKDYVQNKITPVIHSLVDLQYYLASSDLKSRPMVLKFNTGMNRLGIDYQDVSQVIEILKKLNRLNVFHLMSHFASSYYRLKEGDKSHIQMERFKQLIKNFQDAGISIEQTSIANSGAIEQSFGENCSHIRPGLMMYGPYSVVDSAKNWKLHNISRFEVKVLNKISVKRGTPVGYGGHIVPEDGEILLLPIGYGDGISTYIKGHKLFINSDFEFQVLGRVNMDLTMLFTAKNCKIKREEWIRIWDHEIGSLNQLADNLQTIPYALTCGLSARIPKNYVLE